jgi:hypothetical protein
MTDYPPYRPGTILAEMMIDIYASKRRNALTILHDRPFNPPLTGLEFEPLARSLEFIFPQSRRPLGVPLREALVPHFKKSKSVTFFLVDPQTKTALSGVKVPLKIVEKETEDGAKKTGLRGKFRRKSDN